MAFSLSGLTNTLNQIGGVVGAGASIYQAAQGFNRPAAISPSVAAAVMPQQQFMPNVAIGAPAAVSPAVSQMAWMRGDLDYSKFLQLAGRGLDIYQRFQGLGQQRGDILDTNQADDREIAKLVAKRGMIPAASDMGQLAVASGAKQFLATVRYNDGTTGRIPVVKFDARGKGRTRRKNLTSYRIGTAAWVMRKLHAQQKLGKRLVSTAKKLEPARRSAPPKSTRKR